MSAENFPSIDPTVEAAMGRYALLFNTRSAWLDALRQDGRHLDDLHQQGLAVEQRYVMFEASHAATPVGCWRISLAPERPSLQEFGVERLFVRRPSHWDPDLAELPNLPWNDFFIEAITNDERIYYYLNSQTCVQYQPGATFLPNPRETALREPFELYRGARPIIRPSRLPLPQLNKLLSYQPAAQPTK